MNRESNFYYDWAKQALGNLVKLDETPVPTSQVESNHWVQDIGREHEVVVSLSGMDDNDDDYELIPEWLREVTDKQ